MGVAIAPIAPAPNSIFPAFRSNKYCEHIVQNKSVLYKTGVFQVILTDVSKRIELRVLGVSCALTVHGDVDALAPSGRNSVGSHAKV